MYEILKIAHGTVELVDQQRDAAKAQQHAVSQSRVVDAVFAVQRQGFGDPLYYVYRGSLHSATEVIRRASMPDVPPVLTLDPPAQDEPIKPTNKPRRSRKKPDETKARAVQGGVEHKVFPATVINVDEALGIVEAVVNTYGIIDDGEDRVWFGSASKTLAENFGRIRVLNSHNNRNVLDVVGKPLMMRELSRDELPSDILQRYPDATGGLYTKTQYLTETPEGLGVFKRIAAGAVDEYSIGFDTIVSDQERMVDPDTGKQRNIRNIREIRLWEYSPVVWGMNPATGSVSVKSADDPQDDTPDDTKAGRVLNERNYNAIKQAYELLSLVMASAGLTEGDGTDEGKSHNTSTEDTATDGPLTPSTDAPTSTEAGPQDDDTPDTKQADLLKLLNERLAED